MKEYKICSVKNTYETEMMIDILKKHHVPAFRRGIGGAGIMDIYSGNSTFGEEIIVDEEDAEFALQLIGNLIS